MYANKYSELKKTCVCLPVCSFIYKSQINLELSTPSCSPSIDGAFCITHYVELSMYMFTAIRLITSQLAQMVTTICRIMNPGISVNK